MYIIKPIIKRFKRNSICIFLCKIIVYALIRLLFLTYRMKVVCDDTTFLSKGVFYFWHQNIISGMFFFFAQRLRGACIVSPSSDGKIAGYVCSKLGFNVLYGSSYKSSVSVLKKALATLTHTGRLCVVGDGSRGPAFELQRGLLYLSQKTAVPLVFVECIPRSSLTFGRSWDKFKLPLPFTTIIIKVHQPVYYSAEQVL